MAHQRTFHAILGTLFLIGLFFRAHAAEPPPDSASLRKSFEWGEYDKLIEVLEPYLRERPAADSLYAANCHKYLGVAYFSKGRIADARSQFLEALALYSGLSIDRYYISKEIYDLFADASREAALQKRRKMAEDSLLNAKEEQLRQSQNMLKSLDIQRVRRRNLTAGISILSLAAGGAVYSGFAYAKAEQNYDLFVDAARNSNDYRRYRELETAVKRDDRVTIAAVSATALLLLPGTYFTIKALRSPVPALTLVPGIHRHGELSATAMIGF